MNVATTSIFIPSLVSFDFLCKIRHFIIDCLRHQRNCLAVYFEEHARSCVLASNTHTGWSRRPSNAVPQPDRQTDRQLSSRPTCSNKVMQPHAGIRKAPQRLGGIKLTKYNCITPSTNQQTTVVEQSCKKLVAEEEKLTTGNLSCTACRRYNLHQRYHLTIYCPHDINKDCCSFFGFQMRILLAKMVRRDIEGSSLRRNCCHLPLLV